MAKRKSTKGQTHKTKDRVIRTQLKPGGELKCSRRVNSSCSTSGTRRVNLVTNPVISREWGEDREVFTISGTYPWYYKYYIMFKIVGLLTGTKMNYVSLLLCYTKLRKRINIYRMLKILSTPELHGHFRGMKKPPLAKYVILFITVEDNSFVTYHFYFRIASYLMYFEDIDYSSNEYMVFFLFAT